MDNIKLMRTIIVLAAFILMSSAVMYQAVRVDGLVTGSGTDADPLSIDTTTYIATQYDISDKVSAGAASYVNAGGKSGGQTIIGGTGTTDDLSLQTTSGVGASGADMHFLVGNNGATEAMTILNDGNVGIGTDAPSTNFEVLTADDIIGEGFKIGNSDGYFSVTNGTGAASSYEAKFESLSKGSGRKTRFSPQIDAADDSGSTPVFQISPRRSDNTVVQTRPIFELANYTTTVMSASADGTVTFTAPIQLQGYTVATLPSGTTGMTAYVTDATAPTYLGTLTGGGAVVCPVFYNGAAWVSH